jgi:hypothetical protein
MQRLIAVWVVSLGNDGCIQVESQSCAVYVLE